MPHLVLLGDSIFDNARYVPGEPAVIDQVRAMLPADWQATLLAVDGNVTSDVAVQLQRLPRDATHLFVSVGGNDALGAYGLFLETASSVAEVVQRFSEVQAEFRRDYEQMLRVALALNKPATVCTIYDAIPHLGPAERTALGIFNDVILRAAFTTGIPVIDLRLVCDQRADYSPLSPIEPSAIGGAKIARAIAELATTHDFSFGNSVVYK